MSTLLQLRTGVRSEISEPTPGFVSEAEINDWLNFANSDLTIAAGIEATSSQSIATVNGTESYPLASDVGLVEQVELVNNADPTTFTILSPISLSDRVDGKGSPVGWYVIGSNLYLAPLPDAAYTLRVWYSRVGVTLVADSDTPIIPSQYHILLKLYAISQAKRKGDDPAYQTYLQDYVAGRGGMIEYLRNRGASVHRRIVDLYDTGANGL